MRHARGGALGGYSVPIYSSTAGGRKARSPKERIVSTAIVEEFSGMKRCKKCGEEKPLDQFRRHSQSPDGHVNTCSSCDEAGKTRRGSAPNATWQELVERGVPEMCRRGEHNRYCAPDNMIEARFPGFFDDVTHEHTTLREEWQVCMNCGHAKKVVINIPGHDEVAARGRAERTRRLAHALGVDEEPGSPEEWPRERSAEPDLIEAAGSTRVIIEAQAHLESELASAREEIQALRRELSRANRALLLRDLRDKRNELWTQVNALQSEIGDINLEISEIEAEMADEAHAA